jgi:hypothetical protein
MKWLRRLTAGVTVLGAVAELRKLLANPLTTDAVQVGTYVARAMQAIESAEGIDLPDDLVDQIVQSDLRMIQAYYTRTRTRL